MATRWMSSQWGAAPMRKRRKAQAPEGLKPDDARVMAATLRAAALGAESAAVARWMIAHAADAFACACPKGQPHS
jgi:hypothetical protein